MWVPEEGGISTPPPTLVTTTTPSAADQATKMLTLGLRATPHPEKPVCPHHPPHRPQAGKPKGQVGQDSCPAPPAPGQNQQPQGQGITCLRKPQPPASIPAPGPAMASLLPSRTLPLTLVLMVVLAPGAAGLCHLGGGGLGLDGGGAPPTPPPCLPDSERGAHLVSRGWGLAMAVTRHWSLKPSATEPSAHSCPCPGPGGRAASGRVRGWVGVRLGPLDLQVCRVPSFCSPRLPPGGRTSKGPCSANGPQGGRGN